jgi:hypothetical protein
MRCLCCLTRSKEPVPHLGETPTRMPHIRAPYLGLAETGHPQPAPASPPCPDPAPPRVRQVHQPVTQPNQFGRHTLSSSATRSQEPLIHGVSSRWPAGPADSR